MKLPNYIDIAIIGGGVQALTLGSGKVQLPHWVERITSDYPSDKLCHSQQVDLRHLKLRRERILIIGGGLTSSHLAIGAVSLGATVTLMTRNDADPGWLEPKLDWVGLFKMNRR